jgi:repressor LexA
MRPMPSFTHPDQRHLQALQAYWKRARAFPSMPKLCDVLGLASTSSVFAAIGRLTEAGYLERVETRIAPTKKFFSRPVLGPAHAGLPQEVQLDATPELLSSDDFMMDHPERSSYVRVKGDSMVGAGLNDGDFVVVEHKTPAVPGDIVVAVVDGGVTIKYLRCQAHSRDFFLEAANPAYLPIWPSNGLDVLGVVVAHFRRMRR